MAEDSLCPCASLTEGVQVGESLSVALWSPRFTMIHTCEIYPQSSSYKTACQLKNVLGLETFHGHASEEWMNKWSLVWMEKSLCFPNRFLCYPRIFWALERLGGFCVPNDEQSLFNYNWNCEQKSHNWGSVLLPTLKFYEWWGWRGLPGWAYI